MSPTERQAWEQVVAAQRKIIAVLQSELASARAELVGQGLDAVTCRRLLELAGTVVAEDASQMERHWAATTLAVKVLRSIPAPRPVAAPLTKPVAWTWPSRRNSKRQ